jgi:hypothetical protein
LLISVGQNTDLSKYLWGDTMSDEKRVKELCAQYDLPVPVDHLLRGIVEAANRAVFLYFEHALYSPTAWNTDDAFSQFLLWCLTAPATP